MKYTLEQQEQAIIQACKEFDLDCHITQFEHKKDLSTWADKIMSRWFRKSMPFKRTYMYCERLDINFFFSEDGTAMFTYAGYCDSSKEAGNLQKAIMIADRVRLQMKRNIIKLAIDSKLN